MKDEDGILRPLAGIFNGNKYGKEDAEAKAERINCHVAKVELKEI